MEAELTERDFEFQIQVSTGMYWQLLAHDIKGAKEEEIHISLPKLSLPNILLDTFDELVELAVDLVATLPLTLFFLNFIRIIPAIRGLHTQPASH